jgi:hypothetical protein
MTTKNAFLAAGVALAGLAGVAAWAVADGPPPPATAPARPAGTAAAPPAGPGASVLLLTTGQVVRGEATVTPEGYLVKTPLGELPFRRSQVERVFGSLREIYVYKKSRTPDNDPEERLRLAQWCMAQKMDQEASDELDGLLQLEPEHRRARAMRFQVQAAKAAGQAPADAGVMRAGAESAIEPPAVVSSSTLRELRDSYRDNPAAVGRPIIFDLPAPLAIKRYREFEEYVHPALQRTCAKCHNEQSDSLFQLVQARAKRDLENDMLVRANLDATLRLVEPSDPMRSALLSSSINPHKPSGRPILTGPNDPTYRLLMSWVATLKSANAPATLPLPTGTDAAQGATAPGVVDTGVVPAGAFAAGRSGPATPMPGPAQAPAASTSQGPRVETPAALPVLVPAQPDLSGVPNVIQGTPGGPERRVEPYEAGQMLPGSAVGLPSTTPQAGAVPTRGTTQSPANRPKDGSTMFVPGVGEVPVVDISKPRTKPAPTTSATKSVERSKLEQYLLQSGVAPPVPVVR